MSSNVKQPTFGEYLASLPGMRAKKMPPALTAGSQKNFNALLAATLKGNAWDWYNSQCCSKRRAEHFAEAILDPKTGALQKLMNIPVLNRTREKNLYFINTHDGHATTGTKTSNRGEERLALDLYGQYIHGLGEIVEYQMPLKDKRSNKGVGKIDLVAYQEDDPALVLLELKRPGSDETLLRAALEIFTYSKLINQQDLKVDFQKKFAGKFKIPDNPDEIKIKTAVLIGEDSWAYHEYQWGKTYGSWTYKLMQQLGVMFYGYKQVKSIRIV